MKYILTERTGLPLGGIMREFYRKIAGMIAGSILLSSCAAPVKKYTVPLDYKLNVQEKYVSEEIVGPINSLKEKYKNPKEECKINDEKYLDFPSKEEIYDENGTLKKSIRVPSEKDIWSYNLLTGNNIEDSLTKCGKKEIMKGIYEQVKNSSFEYKDGSMVTYLSLYNNLQKEEAIIIFSPEGKKGLLYVEIYKKGKFIGRAYIPISEDKLKEIYKSNEAPSKFISSAAGGLAFSATAGINLLWGLIPGAVSGVYTFATNRTHPLPEFKVDVATLQYKSPEDLYREINALLHLTGVNNVDRFTIVKSKDGPLEILINPKGELYVDKGRISVVNKDVGLTPEKETILNAAIGAVLGKIAKEIAEENSKKKEINVKQQSGSSGGGTSGGLIGSGGGSGQSGNVFGP